MTSFAEHVADYLRLRRSLGYKLEDHARLLRRFAAHLDAAGAEVVTIDLALSWALEPNVPAGSAVRATRLLVVRGFARYLAGIDPRTEIPPTGLIPLRQRRRQPYIYSDAEILALMAQAREGIRQALCASTYETCRPARRVRHADQRGDQARPHGHRLAGRRPACARVEVQ